MAINANDPASIHVWQLQEALAALGLFYRATATLPAELDKSICIWWLKRDDTRSGDGLYKFIAGNIGEDLADKAYALAATIST